MTVFIRCSPLCVLDVGLQSRDYLFSLSKQFLEAMQLCLVLFYLVHIRRFWLGLEIMQALGFSVFLFQESRLFCGLFEEASPRSFFKASILFPRLQSLGSLSLTSFERANLRIMSESDKVECLDPLNLMIFLLQHNHQQSCGPLGGLALTWLNKTQLD